MSILRKLRMLFHGTKNDYVPIFIQQADFLCRASAMLEEMLASTDTALWARIERDIKSCEVQGDALLTEFHEMLSGRWLVQVNKLDLQAVSMAMDDCLDVIKDISKAVMIYSPARLDEQLRELAHLATAQSAAIREMIPMLAEIKKRHTSIALCCERVTELEHAADDDYEDYIGYIFHNEDDVRELVKYKNLAEMLENDTDAFKRISDNVRKLLLNYFSE